MLPNPQLPTVGTQHSPRPQITTDHPPRNTKERMIKSSSSALFLNPNLVTQLMGCSNEAPVIVDGQETTALIDSGAQVSSVSTKFCEDIALQIQPLGQLLELEGTGGAAIPYLVFVEANIQILGIRNHNEDVLLLVIPTTTYSENVPVVVGSKIIDKALSLMPMAELAKATMMWWQAHFGAVMSGLLQLSCASSDKNRVQEETKCSSQEDDPMEVQRFCLDDIRGLVHTTQKVTMLPVSTVSVHANSGVKGHYMRVHVLMELMPGPQLPAAVVPMADLWRTASRVLKGTNLLAQLWAPMPWKSPQKLWLDRWFLPTKYHW